MKLAIRTFRQILDLALIVLVVLVLATVLAVNVMPGLGHQLVVIRGGSMEPAIHLGSTVDVVKVEPSDLRVGDVVTVKSNTTGVLVTHRIAKIQKSGDTYAFQLKGDANKSADSVLVPADSIVGRVNATIPYHGYLIYLLTIPTGIASIFLLAATMLLCIWLLEDLEEEEAEDEEAERAERAGQAVQAPTLALASEGAASVEASQAPKGE